LGAGSKGKIGVRRAAAGGWAAALKQSPSRERGGWVAKLRGKNVSLEGGRAEVREARRAR